MGNKRFVLALLPVLLLALASCGGPQTLNSIGALDYLIGGEWHEGNSFSCGLRVKRAEPGGGHTYFTYNASLEELQEKLQELRPDAAYSTAQGKFIVIEQPGGVFLVEQRDKIEGDRYNRFQIFAPLANIGGKLAYMPYHLLEGLETQTYQGQRELPAQFTCTALAGINDFEAFYRKFPVIEVMRAGERSLVITCGADNACARLVITFNQNQVTFTAGI